MRKHRLAERLLVDVIGLPWEEVHIEACRWEHVISEEVERRLVELLGYPLHCPHGNLIPGLDELGIPPEAREHARAVGHEPAEAMTSAAATRAGRFVVRRISEQVQSDAGLMLRLKHIGIQPGREVTLAASHDGVRVTCDDYSEDRGTELPRDVAVHVFVARR
jgi:DtxR family Mn-dependent transcriptional regulator